MAKRKGIKISLDAFNPATTTTIAARLNRSCCTCSLNQYDYSLTYLNLKLLDKKVLF